MQYSLKKIICEIKKDSIKVENISDDVNLLTDIGLTSVELVSLLFKIEDDIGIEIDMDNFDYKCLSSFSSFSNYISSYQ